MLLIIVKPYKYNFHIFGKANPEDRLPLKSTALNTDYSVRYEAFNETGPSSGRFEYFKYPDHDTTLKLVGYMAFPYTVAFPPSSFIESTKYTMPALMRWYMSNGIKTPFKEWIGTIPSIADQCERSNMGILRSYSGNYYMFYVEKGIVKHERITVTSFIQNGIMTPMSEVIARYERVAVKRLEETRNFLTAIFTEDACKLPEQLSWSEFLNTVPSHK